MSKKYFLVSLLRRLLLISRCSVVAPCCLSLNTVVANKKIIIRRRQKKLHVSYSCIIILVFIIRHFVQLHIYLFISSFFVNSLFSLDRLNEKKLTLIYIISAFF